MGQDSTTAGAGGTGLFAGEGWFDPIEGGIRGRGRGLIGDRRGEGPTHAMGPSRAQRGAAGPKGWPRGPRARQRPGWFGPGGSRVPRGRMRGAGGSTQE